MVAAAVLAGGPSAEHEVSLETGAHLLGLLRAAGHSARPVFIDRDGGWHLGTTTQDLTEAACATSVVAELALEDLAVSGEVAVLGLHGAFGEDGALQSLLDRAGVPYTGSPAGASVIGMDKELSKLAAHQVGARTARHLVVDTRNPPLLRVARSVGYPCFVKPLRGGSSVATCRVDHEDGLPAAVAQAQAADPGGRALIEELVEGTEITCGVLRMDGTVRTLPLIAIRPAAGFYDYRAKYQSDETRFECPAALSAAAQSEIETVSRKLYDALELRGVARVDFILRRDTEEPVFLELNTLPGFTAHSLVPLACRTAGLPLTRMLDALLVDALRDP